MRYDREGDDHDDIVSAYQKSMRGSDRTRVGRLAGSCRSRRSALGLLLPDGMCAARMWALPIQHHPTAEGGN